MNNVERFLEDISFNTKYTFLDEGKNKDEMKKIAKKARLVLPCHDLAIFKGTYAYVDRQNKNGCTLPKEEVEKALDTLRGKAVDFDHLRKRIVGHWIDAELVKDEIIAYGVFFKGNFREDYNDVKKLMEKSTLGVSFEAWGDKEMTTRDTYNLNDIEFAGGALLMQGEPAFDGAEVLEMARERVLEFASVMKKPKSFIRSEEEKTEKDVDYKVDRVENARFSLWDYQAIQKIVNEAEKPKGEEGNYAVVEAIDFKEQKVTIRYEPTNTIGIIDLSVKSKVKVIKKGEKEIVEEKKEEVVELPEEAKMYLHELQTVLGQLFDVECPSCKQVTGKRIKVIDLDNSTLKVQCVGCDAILLVDFTPKAKVVKKGKVIKGVKIVEAEVIKEKDWLEVFETFEGSDNELEEAFMNEVEYDNGAVELKEGKKLTTKERQNISDKMFAVVKNVKNKTTGKPRKIRMFPIHDAAHVRNALARLPQAKATLEKLGVSMESVKRKILKRARELNMKDLLEKYEKSTVEEQAKLFQEVVEANAKLKVDMETKGTEVTTLTEAATKKDEEMATLKTEFDKVKKEAGDAVAEIAKRDKEIRDAQIAKRREELGDLAKDMSDDDVMNEDKFKVAKLEKENADLKAKVEKADKDSKGPEKANKDKEKEEADLDKGSKDKTKDETIFATQKRIDEKAWGKEDSK